MNRQRWVIAQLLLWLSGSLFSLTAIAQTRTASNNFMLHCIGCHGVDGAGSLTGGIPSLKLIKSFTSDQAGRKYLMHVPGIVSSGLSNQDIAAVVNYAVERWGQSDIQFQPFTVEEVDLLRASEIDDIVSYRRDLTARYVAEGKSVAEYPWP